MDMKLKDKIKCEIERVDKRIINLQNKILNGARGDGKPISNAQLQTEISVLNEWSQSLHMIDNMCKERNRY